MCRYCLTTHPAARHLRLGNCLPLQDSLCGGTFMHLSHLFRQRWWMVPVFVGALSTMGVAALSLGPRLKHAGAAEPSFEEEEDTQAAQAVRVETVHPTQGGIERTTVQPGTLQAFESAALYAEVSGYLKTQTVDIGARVQKGQVLATIDVP